MTEIIKVKLSIKNINLNLKRFYLFKILNFFDNEKLKYFI